MKVTEFVLESVLVKIRSLQSIEMTKFLADSVTESVFSLQL